MQYRQGHLGLRFMKDFLLACCLGLSVVCNCRP
jgi:hypothetical protein